MHIARHQKKREKVLGIREPKKILKEAMGGTVLNKERIRIIRIAMSNIY